MCTYYFHSLCMADAQYRKINGRGHFIPDFHCCNFNNVQLTYLQSSLNEDLRAPLRAMNGELVAQGQAQLTIDIAVWPKFNSENSLK